MDFYAMFALLFFILVQMDEREIKWDFVVIGAATILLYIGILWMFFQLIVVQF